MNERTLYEMSKNEPEDAYAYSDFELNELLRQADGTATDKFVNDYKAFHTDIKTSKMVHDEDW